MTSLCENVHIIIINYNDLLRTASSGVSLGKDSSGNNTGHVFPGCLGCDSQYMRTYTHVRTYTYNTCLYTRK